MASSGANYIIRYYIKKNRDSWKYLMQHVTTKSFHTFRKKFINEQLAIWQVVEVLSIKIGIFRFRESLNQFLVSIHTIANGVKKNRIHFLFRNPICHSRNKCKCYRFSNTWILYHTPHQNRRRYMKRKYKKTYSIINFKSIFF